MKPIIKSITDKWITKNTPCQEAIEWWDKKERDSLSLLDKMMKAEKYDWANWFIVRIMTYHDCVSYAVYAAEQVINLYETKYPDDDRPRKAIEAAKKCIKNPSAKNKKAAYAAAKAAAYAADAAYAAYAASYAAYTADAAYEASYAASYAAKAAAYAAKAASYAVANAAPYAAKKAASYAAKAVYAAYAAATNEATKFKILNYGLGLLNQTK